MAKRKKAKVIKTSKKVETNDGFLKRVLHLILKPYSIIVVILTLAGSIPTCNYIKEKYFTSAHDKFIDNNYVQGDLKAPIFTGDEHALYSIAELKPNFTNKRANNKRDKNSRL